MNNEFLEKLKKNLYEESIDMLNKEYEEKYLGHKYDRILCTEEIRFMMHYALQNAKERLWISCPWLFYDDEGHSFLEMSANNLHQKFNDYCINTSLTIKNEIDNLMNKTQTPSLLIQFGYFSKRPKQKKKELKSLVACEYFLNIYEKKSIKLFYQVPNHQKMLLMDDALMVVGSYNYLSYPGITDDVGYRKEKAYLTTDKKMIENAWEELENEEVEKICSKDDINKFRERIIRGDL